jgi:hypothetical protein
VRCSKRYGARIPPIPAKQQSSVCGWRSPDLALTTVQAASLPRARADPATHSPRAHARLSSPPSSHAFHAHAPPNHDRWRVQVLSVRKASVIDSTLATLPADLLRPLLKALVERAQTQPVRAMELSQWLQTLLTAHTASFLAMPQIHHLLAPLYQVSSTPSYWMGGEARCAIRLHPARQRQLTRIPSQAARLRSPPACPSSSPPRPCGARDGTQR